MNYLTDKIDVTGLKIVMHLSCHCRNPPSPQQTSIVGYHWYHSHHFMGSEQLHWRPRFGVVHHQILWATCIPLRLFQEVHLHSECWYKSKELYHHWPQPSHNLWSLCSSSQLSRCNQSLLCWEVNFYSDAQWVCPWGYWLYMHACSLLQLHHRLDMWLLCSLHQWLWRSSGPNLLESEELWFCTPCMPSHLWVGFLQLPGTKGRLTAIISGQ